MPDQPPDRVSMDPLESNIHSFIIKIWLEETAEEAGRVTWRGHITHVPGGERRYLQDLDKVAAFITPYLEEMGVKVASRREKRWLERLKACLGSLSRSQ